MLYEFESGHNATDATKNICHTKGESVDDHITSLRNYIWVARALMIRHGQVCKRP